MYNILTGIYVSGIQERGSERIRERKKLRNRRKIIVFIPEYLK